jgi:hypothetical protein
MKIAIEYVAPTVSSLTYVNATVSSLTYVSAAVAAYLDFEGWDRRIADTVLTPELYRVFFEKYLVDTVVPLELIALHVQKPFASGVSTSDFTSRRVEYVRLFEDTAPATENHTFTFDKTLDDTFSTTDTTAFAVAKYLLDAFGMNDSTDVNDGSTWTYVKQINNVVFAQDLVSRVSTKAVADTATISSSGTLVSQNYCDPTYFASDYVGVSRVFT